MKRKGKRRKREREKQGMRSGQSGGQASERERERKKHGDTYLKGSGEGCRHFDTFQHGGTESHDGVMKKKEKESKVKPQHHYSLEQ